MNFAAFQSLRENLLGQHDDVLDCGETNLYRALARLAPPPAPPSLGTAHRCHLAEAWAKLYGFPDNAARRALVSCGVRDSLERLFRHYARGQAQLWLPADNYPVFGDLARAAGLEPRTFPTLPKPRWPEAKPAAGAEILLVTNPLKPLGRSLSAADVTALSHWLVQSPERRLLLDTVYTFDTRFQGSTMQLLATGQTLLLHSLTKGWLAPRCFGITLAPAVDAPVLTPIFREQPPPQTHLARARDFFLHHVSMPSAVGRELAQARQRLLERLPGGPTCLSNQEAYFFPVAGRWSDLLEQTRLLGIPATAFGSAREDITVLSSLSFIA